MVYPCLADDIEWITPKRTLIGIDAVEQDLTWGTPPDHVDVEFQISDWADIGDGRLVVYVHQVYRLKETGELAYERNRRIHVTIRDDKVGRYEMEAIG